MSIQTKSMGQKKVTEMRTSALLSTHNKDLTHLIKERPIIEPKKTIFTPKNNNVNTPTVTSNFESSTPFLKGADDTIKTAFIK